LTIGTYGIVGRITMVLIIPLQGILKGVHPMIGYNYGAGMKRRVGEILKQSCIMAAYYGVFVSLFLFVFSDQFMYLFSADTGIIGMGSVILRITCLGTAFSRIQMIQTAFLQAISKFRISFLLSLCNGILCFLPVMLLFSVSFGLKGVLHTGNGGRKLCAQHRCNLMGESRLF